MNTQQITLKLVLIEGGLNQIYTNSNMKFTNYADLAKHLTENYFPNNELKQEAFIQNLDTFNIPFHQKNDFLFLEETVIHDQIISQNHQIILTYETQVDLNTEYFLLHSANLSKYFTFSLNDNFNKELTSHSDNIIIFSNNLSTLHHYHKTFNTWCVYLTNYIFTTLNMNKLNPLGNQNVENVQYLNQHGRFFHFSSLIFIQIGKVYLNLIARANKIRQDNQVVSKGCILDGLINELHPIKVLLVYKFLFKKCELKRAKHYISNEKVLFVSLTTGMIESNLLPLELNGKVDTVLCKISDSQEATLYKELIGQIEEYQNNGMNLFPINSFRNLHAFTERKEMIKFMKDFCEEVSQTSGNKLSVPSSYCVDYVKVVTLTEMKLFLEENHLQLPLIIKYSHPNHSDFNHLLILITSEVGLANYVEYFKKYSEGCEEDVKLVVQRYVNHSGWVMKLYRVNKQGKVFYRPSLPDVNNTLNCEEFKEGFYKISTDQLLSEEYLKLWGKLSKPTIEKDIDLELLNSISDQFEIKSGASLFGLDFIFDGKDYYLIDCNLFPGYKEMVDDFNDVITEHIVTIKKEYLNKQEK